MSSLKGKLGRSAVVVAFALGAFQALSIVGALPASAVPTCSVTAGVITAAAPGAGDNLLVYLDQNNGIHVAGNTGGVPPVPGAPVDFLGCNGSTAGIATTTTINLTGDSGPTLNDQTVTIQMALYSTVAPIGFTTKPANWGKINWNVNLGSNSANGDSLVILNSPLAALTDTARLNVTGGANGLDLNSDGDLDLTMAGVELFYVDSSSNGPGPNVAPPLQTTNFGNVVNLGGSTITGGPSTQASIIGQHPTVLNAGYTAGLPASMMALTTGDNLLSGGSGNDVIRGGLGADTIAPGLGSDSVDCGASTSPNGVGYESDGNPTIDYSNTTTAINGNLAISTVTQGTDLDSLNPLLLPTTTCQNIIGTSAADTLMGDTNYNWFVPGGGNDTINGGTEAAPSNGVDYNDAATGVTVDLTKGTATGGSGSDTITNVDDVYGSANDDVIIGNGHANFLEGAGGNDTMSGGAGGNDGNDTFRGDDGIDTVDYSHNTTATKVDLTNLTCPCGATTLGEADTYHPNDIENAILGSGNDTFVGTAFNNTVWPNGGQNALAGGGGIDTVNYSMGYTAGVTVNLAGGGPSGGNQDSFTGGSFVNAVGTPFADNMIGTDLVGGTNGANRLVGGKGADSLSGNAGPDFIQGGAGNDSVRGGSGDDNLYGQDGNDNIRGGNGDDDIWGGKGKDTCSGGGGNNLVKGCEKSHKTARRTIHTMRARLAALKP